jgi:predicted nuclease of predicted toxin-antitoxin system
MGLRFFADHCISNAIMQALREAGHEVLRLRDYLPVESPDPIVIAQTQQLDAVLLALNGDFADIVTYPPANYQGIIALQVRNHPEIIPQLMARLLAYLSSHADREHYRGRLLLVEVHRIRVRQ